jgi:hypothetical protein
LIDGTGGKMAADEGHAADGAFFVWVQMPIEGMHGADVNLGVDGFTGVEGF